MKLLALAGNTFREAVRDRIFLGLVIIAFLVTAGAKVVPAVAAGEEAKIIKDLGLKSMALFGVLIAILVGARLVQREIEKRTIHVILSKSVSRWQFLAGKYLGLMGVLLASIFIMTVWFGLFMILSRVPLDIRLLLPVGMLILELAIVTAVATFFSTLASPTLSAVFTLGIYVVGNMNRSLLYWVTKDRPPAVQAVARFFHYLMPNLENLDVTEAVVHHLPLDPQRVLLSAGHAVLYAGAVLVLAILLFERKDF